MQTGLAARGLRVALLATLWWLAGCAVLPARNPVPPQYAITDVADTPLARICAASRGPDQQALSGFRLLPEASFAFAARTALARRAVKSLDVQYYLIQDDDVGRTFLRELRDAAGRGVRVRLLVDDIYTGGEDDLLSGLAAYPNVQVRLFNPLPVRGGSVASRMLRSLGEFSRVNHRMHNKLFIADNSMSVSGGRNIANEYFMRAADANFIDIDVMSAGPVVQQLSSVFDSYWNSDHVYPLSQVVSPAGDGEAARKYFDDRVRDTAPPEPERERDVLGQTPVAAQLDAGRLTQAVATAEVFADSPDKAAGIDDDPSKPHAPTVTERTLALFETARKQVEIASPYFIPGPRGMSMMQAAHATPENDKIVLLTNSLGANDEPLAYAGYAEYRLAMLKAGVNIFELSPTLSRDSDQVGNFGKSFGRLHAKVAIIDHRWMFVGSMNLDPRSADLNTESGLAIDSPQLAAGMVTLAETVTHAGAYKLRLAADGEHIEWVENRPDGMQVIHTEEPDASWSVRARIWLERLFVPDALL